MLENSIELLAHAIDNHAHAVAELAQALKASPTAANDTPFVDAVKVKPGEDPMDPPFEPTAPTTEAPKAPTAEEALKGVPVPPPTAPAAEPAEPAEPAEAPKAYTLDDARGFVCRILKWTRTAANTDGTNPLDKIFADVGAKRVQALTPEQCATFCTNAAEFCKAHEVA